MLRGQCVLGRLAPPTQPPPRSFTNRDNSSDQTLTVEEQLAYASPPALQAVSGYGPHDAQPASDRASLHAKPAFRRMKMSSGLPEKVNARRGFLGALHTW